MLLHMSLLFTKGVSIDFKLSLSLVVHPINTLSREQLVNSQQAQAVSGTSKLLGSLRGSLQEGLWACRPVCQQESKLDELPSRDW